MTRRFQTLDVFTETALTGNPLAVVLDAEGLDDAGMQRIAAEFNLSETVFVFEPRNAINSARVRIFTPKRELPFAGHPTVGAAALIAHRRASDLATGAFYQYLRSIGVEPMRELAAIFAELGLAQFDIVTHRVTFLQDGIHMTKAAP